MAHGKLTVVLFLTLESSASQVTDNCGGSCLPLLCFPEPKVLAGTRGPGVPTRKGKGVRKPSRTLRKGAFCPGGGSKAVQVPSVIWQRRVSF